MTACQLMILRNATYILGFRAVTYAIAAGNTVVLKASETAPRSLGVVGTVFREAGLPDGVLNVIQHHPEDAAEITKKLIEHPAIRKINFTGSTAVGRIIAKLAGEIHGALKPAANAHEQPAKAAIDVLALHAGEG